MKKSIVFFAATLLGLASCSDSFLDRQYEGGILSQEKYDQLSSEKLEGTLMGCYAMIYTMNGDAHDEFGQRSIDLWGDILSGDIAVTNKTYGWLYVDEQMVTRTYRTGTIWAFYYNMIHNINVVINSIESSSQISSIVAQHGYPADTTTYEYTAEQTNYALYLAQAKALRGYCYANLARWYTPIFTIAGYTMDNYKCVPVYTEENMTQAQGLSTSGEVYNRVFDDLGTAVTLFETFGAWYEELNEATYARSTKLAIDVNVARGLLAYAYLNAAPYYTNVNDDKAKTYYRKAHQYAHDAIESNAFRIIPNSMLYSTGFNDVSEASWMWGQNVVTETAGRLKSWFGQM
ncbi:MAG: RagB/SusD family nutrient uptake outer membrane protein, partial [Paludibacteraceae bacterium]